MALQYVASGRILNRSVVMKKVVMVVVMVVVKVEATVEVSPHRRSTRSRQ